MTPMWAIVLRARVCACACMMLQRMESELGIERTRLIKIYGSACEQLYEHYACLIHTPDYVRVTPLLGEYAAACAASGCEPRTVATADGHGWKGTRVGKGAFARTLVEYIQLHHDAGFTVNLFQQGMCALYLPSMY
jgi:hypothetical protein